MPRSQQGLIRLLRRQGVDERVVQAFAEVARVDFVPQDAGPIAYADRPVSIPEGQTTSQPSLIARMVEAAAPTPSGRVLEVGTGFGFQTALLARLAGEVFSIERFEVLAEAARRNLDRAGIENARVIVGDGWKGIPQHQPFDAIVVSAAAEEVPRALEEQLAEGGRMVIPVKGPLSDDVLVFVKQGGRVTKHSLLTPARFVPLVREGKP
ncbi:MAG TPA: protein-L-isoaspartate(D-aspartate) O-methyltransferase [Actinomycetota bacterium]|nr:protein-L-isoaspartate(D-aspartate) O-methyltransferase [Actinomycetota bacterium]